MTERNVPARPGRVTDVKDDFRRRAGRDQTAIKAGLLMTAQLCVALQRAQAERGNHARSAC